MKLGLGKYHGCEISEIPADYLEWAIGHLPMDDSTELAVVAECARRSHQEKVESVTPGEAARAKVGKAVTKIIANHHP